MRRTQQVWGRSIWNKNKKIKKWWQQTAGAGPHLSDPGIYLLLCRRLNKWMSLILIANRLILVRKPRLELTSVIRTLAQTCTCLNFCKYYVFPWIVAFAASEGGECWKAGISGSFRSLCNAPLISTLVCSVTRPSVSWDPPRGNLYGLAELLMENDPQPAQPVPTSKSLNKPNCCLLPGGSSRWFVLVAPLRWMLFFFSSLLVFDSSHNVWMFELHFSFEVTE